MAATLMDKLPLDPGFPQWGFWESRLSGMWHFVAGLAYPNMQRSPSRVDGLTLNFMCDYNKPHVSQDELEISSKYSSTAAV